MRGGHSKIPGRLVFALAFLSVSFDIRKPVVAISSSGRDHGAKDHWVSARRAAAETAGLVTAEGKGDSPAGSPFRAPPLSPSSWPTENSEPRDRAQEPEPTPEAPQRNDLNLDLWRDPDSLSFRIPDHSESFAPPAAFCQFCRRPLKVYMYPLPRKFNFGILSLIPEASRSLEWIENIPDALWHTLRREHFVAYFLTADLMNPYKNVTSGSIVERVEDPEEADAFFVPFFSSASYEQRQRKGVGENGSESLEDLEAELLSTLQSSPWWKRSGGRDHVIAISHPNALSEIRRATEKAIFIVPDFDRFEFDIAHLRKDVVAPYVHLVPLLIEASTQEIAARDSFDKRATLLFFQGTVWEKKWSFELRRKVMAALEGEEGVEFVSTRPVGQEKFDEAAIGFHNSRFCLHIAGDTASSCRLFDAIASLCVPVIVSDRMDLPFEDVLHYKHFAIFVPEKVAVERGAMVSFLRGVSRDSWLRLWTNLNKVQHHFHYQVPAMRGDAVDMIWQQIEKKLPAVRHVVHREARLLRPEWWSLV